MLDDGGPPTRHALRSEVTQPGELNFPCRSSAAHAASSRRSHLIREEPPPHGMGGVPRSRR